VSPEATRSEQIASATRAFLRPDERVVDALEARIGPGFLATSMLFGILGFVYARRPRWVVLTDQRLLLLKPRSLLRREPALDLFIPLGDIRAQRVGGGADVFRIRLAASSGLRIGLNFHPRWHRAASRLARALGASGTAFRRGLS